MAREASRDAKQCQQVRKSSKNAQKVQQKDSKSEKRLRGGIEVPKRPGKIDIEIKTIHGQKASPLVSISSILKYLL